jgi:hypothetical protein
VRAWLAGSFLVIAGLLPGGWSSVATSSDEIEAELIGFLVQLPRDGLHLPPPSVVAAALEVPNEQGGPRVVFPVEFGARTEVTLRASHVRDGELVVLEGVLYPGRLRVLHVREVDVAEFRGRVSLPGGPLSLPPTTDQLVDVFLDGSPTLPVAFLLTPRTTSPRMSLRDGQPVSLGVVIGRRLVVDLETR